MAPVITKIICIEELVTYLQIKELELGFGAALVDDLSITVGGIGITISFPCDLKFM